MKTGTTNRNENEEVKEECEKTGETDPFDCNKKALSYISNEQADSSL